MEQLEQCGRQLAVLREPDVSLNFGRLYRTAAERAGRSRRRWRHLAVATCVAAGLMLAVLASRLRVDWRPGRLAVSWNGDLPATAAVDPGADEASPAASALHEERIEALEEVARLLSAELAASDRRQAAALAELRPRLARSEMGMELLARQMSTRWRLAERDIRDLYLTQFSPHSNQKGTIP
jgi:hypothetical protein